MDSGARLATEVTVDYTVLIKPRLHVRLFACTGDAIFLKIVASPAHGGGYRRKKSCGVATRTKVRGFVTKYSTLATFFCDFFSCRIACSWVAIRAIFTVLWRRDNFSKNRITCHDGLWPQKKITLIILAEIQSPLR